MPYNVKQDELTATETNEGVPGQTGCPDYEYQLHFALSRLGLQKNVNVLRYKCIPESLLSP